MACRGDSAQHNHPGQGPTITVPRDLPLGLRRHAGEARPVLWRRHALGVLSAGGPGGAR
jgi:hypothetical protein